MTTIAWDGKVLAADRRAVTNWVPFEVSKIRRIRDMRCAVSGDLDTGVEMLAWLTDGATPETFPVAQRDADKFSRTLVVREGVLWCYESSPVPFAVLSPFCAFGSGRDFALMAMRLGYNAIDAVKLASEFDLGTGGGVDWLD